jgi:hypothetical protein
MKKTLILFTLLLFTLSGFSQPRKYKKSMEKALASLNEASTPEALAACAASFEEIASLYPDDWMPSYYAAYCLVSASFNTGEYTVKTDYLNQAGTDLDRIRSLMPEESEVEALKAYHALGMMAADPQSNGPIYLEDFNICIGKAKKLNPDNPRPYYMDGLLKANLPEYMGGGPEAAKLEHRVAAQKYAEFRNDDPCWPRWGEALNQEALEGLQ